MNNLMKISWILSKSQKLKSIQMFVLLLVGVLFETLSIGLIIPLSTVILNPSLLLNYVGETFFNFYLSSYSEFHLIFLGLLLLVVLYFLKTLFLIYLVWFKNIFSYSVLADVSKRIFENYLLKDWVFYLNNNSAKSIRNCSTECSVFVNYIFLPVIGLIAEVMVLFGILVLLIVIEPIGTLVNFTIFFLFGYIYNNYFKNKILLLGKLRQKLEYDKLKYLQQGFGALRDIKIINSEKFFLDQYNSANIESCNSLAKHLTIKQLPRLILEFIALVCIVTIVISMIIKNSDLSSIIPTLAMFGAASMRLLPSTNRILEAVQNISYGKSSIDIVYQELTTYTNKSVDPEEQREDLKFKRSISLKKISFHYKSNKNKILHNININIPKGKFIGIIGESGAGKSTLIDILLGLLKPDTGLVQVDNVNISKNINSWQKKIGYVPQDIYLIDDTLKQNIAFGVNKDKIDNKQVMKVIRMSKLEEFVNSLEGGLDTVFGERGIRLSGGQLQRIAIARALYREPEILILDEATSALDVQTENFVMDSVKNLRGLKTILFITHRMTTIKNCDYLYKLNNGVIEQEGKPIDILG
jgi:ATP-binding cassette, subfamily B, bacterial PglK